MACHSILMVEDQPLSSLGLRWAVITDVLPGMPRPFERPATLPLPDHVGTGQALDGLLVAVPDAKASAVIAPPHPQMGGSMASPVVSELAWASERAGLSSLRFDWRGVGASSGEASGDLEQADIDFACAAAFLSETVEGPLVSCGYSFGAIAALRFGCVTKSVERMVLVAPPTGMLDPESLLAFTGSLLVVAGQNDSWVDFRLLGEVTLGAPQVQIEVLPQCDHFFMTQLGPLSRCIEGWLTGAGTSR